MAKKFKWRREAAVFAAIATVALLGADAGGSDGRPRARTSDLIATRIGGAAIKAAMQQYPRTMIDPSIDDGEVFSYFARPSIQLGVRGEQYATQVVDGHLWTGAAEWLPLLGDSLAPVDARIWTPERGYLPCINYVVTQGPIEYRVKAFQFYPRAGEGLGPVNFIRVTAANVGAEAAEAAFASGVMYGKTDHRCQRLEQGRFNPLARHELKDAAAWRDGKLILAARNEPDQRLERRGREYRGPFRGARRDEPVCLMAYRRALAPGEEFSADFALPHYPAGPAAAEALAGADFDERLEAFAAYWEGWLGRGASFRVPEQKVNDASRAYVIHAIMSQNVISDDEIEQHVNRLQYNRFWLRDSSYFVSFYEKWGYPELARALSRHFFGYQRPDGNFLSQSGQLDGWGQSMWAFGNHVRYSGDLDFAAEALPAIERAVAWLKQAVEHDAWGVMPPTSAFDNEMIRGRYTGHNFWALTGLDAAIDLCELAGRDDLVVQYRELRESYHQRFMERLRAVAAERGDFIPPGLDVPGGTSWGNLLPVYPGLIMDPFDPLVTSTFDQIREQHMEEGISMWFESLHHYVTERIAQTALVRGEQEKALDDFYGMLLHTGACHEGFEWGVFPWGNRDYCLTKPGLQTCNFTPHGWYAIDFDLLYRNLLVREQGDAIHLCSAVSPEWARPGERIEVKDAPVWVRTEAGLAHGTISYVLEFDAAGATLQLERPRWSAPAGKLARLIFHVPYFAKLERVPAGARALDPEGAALELDPGVDRVRFDWKLLPHEAKSYAASVAWYKAEYRRRWEESRH